MLNILRELCELNAPSGGEAPVRDYVIKKIDGHCEWRIDPLGNILFEKKGKKRAKTRLMIDAHMDEVGIIVTGITEGGFLRFKTVGGIEKECLLFRRVIINGSVEGVTGNKPIHLCRGDEEKKLINADVILDFALPDREGEFRAICEEIRGAYPDYTVNLVMDIDA